ncbi:MAG: hypothetical protein ACOC80_15475 [Petrotogales bacterium]
MVKNELEFRNLVASLLEKEGFSVQKEFKLPEGYRVDLLAIKDDVRRGIEVKLEQRGISDDISKGSMLHKMPELDYIYVAAPNMLISSELVSYARRLRIGVIGVKEDSIEWLQESEKLKPAQLLGGGSLPNRARYPGSMFEVSKHIKNHGEKIVRHLEMFYIPSGPFVTAPGEKSRFKLEKLPPGESWEVKFKIKIKKSAKVGTYPLFVSCTADNLKTSDDVWYIQITHEDSKS